MPYARHRENNQQSDTFVTNVFKTGSIVKTKKGWKGLLEIIDDTPTPGFARLSRAGVIVLNDVAITRVSREVVDGHYTWADGYCTRTGDMIGDVLYWNPAKSTMPTLTMNNVADGNTLLLRAYARANEAPIMGGEILATLNQTVSMVRNPFKSATSLLTRMSKYRASRLGKTAASAAKATADTWLEYRYGWKPIILDTQKVIRDANKIRAKTDRFRSVARAGDKCEIKVSNNWPATSATHFMGGHYSMDGKVRCNAGVVYEMANRTPTDQAGAYFGATSRDILPTIWELTPFSFVVDWFVNVGDWLQVITPNPDLNVLGHWVTTVLETTTSCGGYHADNGDGVTGSAGSEVVKNFTMIRTCNQEMTITPTMTGLSLSTLQQADAAALLLKPILTSLQSFRHR